MAFILCLLLPCMPSSASTAFFVHHEGTLLARNYDWKSGHGYVFKNLKGQRKYAYGWSGQHPASWTSKYGSVTFNQFGKEFPIGGMNETGLVVEQILLPHSTYPNFGGPSVSNSEWVQYQLDNFSNVDEVLKNIESLQIYPLETVHFFVADKAGRGAVIDFVNGNYGIHLRTQHHMVLTTENYLDSEQYFEREKHTDNIVLNTNLDRYVHLKRKIQNIDVDEVYIAFGLLQQVASSADPYPTQWSVVYDLENLKIHYKGMRSPNEKVVEFSDLDFSELGEIEVTNITEKQVSWKPYNTDIIRFLFQKSQSIKSWYLDENLFLSHLQDPSSRKIDQQFQEYYRNILFRFITKDAKGLLSFILIKKENSFPPKFESVKAGQLIVAGRETQQMLYGIPKGELSLACFQDINFEGEVSNRVLSSPNNFQFLKQVNGSQKQPPIILDTQLDIKDDTEIIIKIR